ncbi:MAG: AraC family transcriptional regulator ligand-binding domain-containing protein [Pseudomonadota bacterium]|nr:AraC family transcriptional regulator ligand-binding domain-containing protein [Pseudomonadota bacterium]
MTSARLHIAVELIEAIGEYLTAGGYDAGLFYQSQGLDPETAAGNGYVDFKWFSQLLDAAAALTGDHYIGLKVGENFLARHWGRLGYLIMAGDNGMEGVQYLQRFASIVTNALEMRWHSDATTLTCEFRLLDAAASRHVVDYFVSSSLSLSRANADATMHYHEVAFQHGGGPDPHFYQSFLQTRCRFQQPANAVTVELAGLDKASNFRDPRLKKILEQHAAQVLSELAASDQLLEQVQRTILEQLPQGAPTLGQVAARLQQPERTLQRRLAGHSVNFQELVDEVRRRLALEYMRNDYNLLDIAMMLGYSEQSAFHRAFKRWTGSTPSRYRRDQAAGSPGDNAGGT